MIIRYVVDFLVLSVCQTIKTTQTLCMAFTLVSKMFA